MSRGAPNEELKHATVRTIIIDKHYVLCIILRAFFMSLIVERSGVRQEMRAERDGD